jgi:uncharacterized protein YeaO (DUF488 family)
VNRARDVPTSPPMAIRIVQLGTPRTANEGVRLGTVRRPPRGVPKAEFARRDFYDLWLPALSPSAELVKQALQAAAGGDEREWAGFVKRFRTEMKQPEASQLLDVLAALSHQTNFALGCYCDDEARCHRSVLRALLDERAAAIAA